MIYKTLHIKRKIRQHNPHEKPGVNSGIMLSMTSLTFSIFSWRNTRNQYDKKKCQYYVHHFIPCKRCCAIWLFSTRWLM